MKKTKNLLKPTKAQIVYRNQLWADALRKNKKKSRERMCANGGRCCLAVAQDVAITYGVEVDESQDENDYVPTKSVGDFFGWGTFVPNFELPNGTMNNAVAVNDSNIYNANGSKGMTHKRIAECVENTFVHPKNPKWTFKLK
tara:strand:- start:11264 stop:11689 length:426 start_codon:yes stop_codon:yes gene_type:complete